MSLLEQDITKMRQVNNKVLTKPEKEFEARDEKEYEVETIIDIVVYGQLANSNQMPGFYYLVLWKGYPEEENT